MSFLHSPLQQTFVLGAMAFALMFAAHRPALAQTQQERIIAGYAAKAKSPGGAPVAFSAKRGQALFLSRPATGKPDTPSCTTCHGKDPAGVGQTRAGKPIDPMAFSKSPRRFSDAKKVKKWFRRNCKSVLGRPCSALEKGEFLTFMMSQ